MAINLQNLINQGQLKKFGQRVMFAIKPLAKAFKSAEVKNNAVYFYASEDKSGEPIFTFNLGEEQFLDQTGTTFVDEFHFSAETYTGATDPNLEGKPVLVMALKSSDSSDAAVKYNFANLEKLIKTYESKNGSLKFNQFDVSVNISAEDDNVLQLKTDGLYVPEVETAVDNATENNIASFDANGKVKDSGIGIATDAEVDEMLDSIGFTAN